MIQSKKGQSAAILGGLLLALMMIMLLFLTAVPMNKIWTDISDELKQEENFGRDNRTVEKIDEVDGFITPAFDQFIFFGFVGMILVLLVTAVFLRDSPIFLVFLFIGVIIIAIIASQFVNVTDEIGNNEAFENSTEEFTLSNVIMGPQLPIIIVIFGIVAVLIMLANSSGRGGGG